MKGVVSLRDLQSLGKSQQHLLLPGHFPILACAQNLILQFRVSRRFAFFQQGLALSFACVFEVYKG